MCQCVIKGNIIYETFVLKKLSKLFNLDEKTLNSTVHVIYIVAYISFIHKRKIKEEKERKKYQGKV